MRPIFEARSCAVMFILSSEATSIALKLTIKLEDEGCLGAGIELDLVASGR